MIFNRATFFRLVIFCLLALVLGACQSENSDGSESEADEPTAVSQANTPNPLNTAVAETDTPEPGETAVATEPPDADPTEPADEDEPEETETAVATEPPTLAEPTAIPTLPPSDFGEGALIDVQMDGTVGVLLDGIPPALLDDTVAYIMSQDDAYWESMAYRQMTLTKYRLNFRNFKRPGKGQLPLPPEPLWQITVDDAEPRRVTIQDHDLIVRDYQFQSTLLTNAASVAVSEPQLSEIGGTWDEPFILPLDPDYLLQRTDIACVNEAGFPPNSYDSENVRTFYDFSCTPGSTTKVGCHRTRVPSLSCIEAVDQAIGRLNTAVRFVRLEWDDELADSVRVGDVFTVDTPELDVYEPDLEDYRVIYRYFGEESCAISENAVGSAGWRRLLQFTATLHNVGGGGLSIGPVVAEDPSTNIFQYDSCHDHFHYSNYGNFVIDSEGAATGGKRAFCVESTNRFSNNEASPLTHDFSCTFQGIEAGWVDEYIAGLDTQWIDITELEFEEETAVADLSFEANGDQFLCEGTAVLDENGEQLYEPSGERTQTGLPISRPQCELNPNWQSNNAGSREITLSAIGSFVTEPCTADQFGQLRNCGFELESGPEECPLGEMVTVTMNLDQPMVLRACEVSDKLGVGVACTAEDAVINVIMGIREESAVQFACPVVRDYEADLEDEDARIAIGGYSLYIAPFFEDN